MSASIAPGRLFVVATPIGNLEDITLRALATLRAVTLVAAEDTRTTRKLLARHGIHTPLVSCYKDREAEQADRLVRRLLAGADIALVSEAGTPGLADPGALVVERARQAGIPVVPIPGPSALACALSAAGPGFVPFLFVGFLPAKVGERQGLLRDLAQEPFALACYETPQRILATLSDCLAILGDRPVLLAREMTKLHEEMLVGRLAEVLAQLAGQERVRGELVLLIGAQPRPDRPSAGAEVPAILRWYRDRGGLSLKDAARQVAKDLGLARGDVYRLALDIWREPGAGGDGDG
ncbi:MAG: 16S rRNA (cytidine(1402)-2'-O)-methyltransferase [Thermodesulfobacteriota bacterium]